jgi:hypothetical protein
MKKLIYTEELITPTRASQILEANIKNRDIRQPRVDKYANDIISGRWKEGTGESIKISKTGIVLDGQHRLHAIIKANKAVVMLVISGIEDSVFDVIDTGSSRNATDVFKIADVKNSSTIPSIIATFNLLEGGKKIGAQVSQKSTNAMLMEQYQKDEHFWQWVARDARVMYHSFARILSPSFLGGFYAHFHKLNPVKAELFMMQLTTGIGVENNIINLLRNKLIQDKMSPRKMPPNLKMALIIKAWNYFVKGDGGSVKLLKFDTIRDEFPKAISK